MERIGFGGGCHWCTEAVFQLLAGVGDVRQGFIRSDPPDDAWSEAVELDYDSGGIALAVLIEVHLRTHASTSDHKLRGKYRSAVYVFNDDQRAQTEAVLGGLQAAFDAPLVARVLWHRGFKPSAPKYQSYYATDPERPFCKTYIDHKLSLLRKQFGTHVKT